MAGESESWTELLPESPIFERLKEAGALPEGEANVMCQIRGELFVWSHKERALLTTSLKKMTASPERYGDFQASEGQQCKPLFIAPFNVMVQGNGQSTYKP